MKKTNKSKYNYVREEAEEEPIIEDGAHSARVYMHLALGARKTTAVLKIHPAATRPGLWMDIGLRGTGNDYDATLMHSLGKAGFYSAAFVLQRVLADVLDQNPEEIYIASMNRRKIYDDRGDEEWVGEITLADRLANGSGIVRELSENFSEFVALCLGKRSSLNGPFAEYLLSQAHAKSCMTVCPKCLQTYFNSIFHGLLDWRLGVMTLRMIAEPDYACGLDMNFEYPEFCGQEVAVDKAAQLLSLAAGFEYIHPAVAGRPVALLRSKTNLIGIAPGMWKRDAHLHLAYPALKDFINEHNPDGLDFRWTDVFNTLRQTSQALRALTT